MPSNMPFLKDKWSVFEYVVLDLEGTGAQHQEQEGIVDIAGVVVRDGRVTEVFYQQFLNPGIHIPPFISQIHGIYDKDVIDKPYFAEIRMQLEAFLKNRILVAHNANVERRVLRLKIPEYAPPAILDTLKLSRELYKEYKKHGLDELINRFQLTTILSHIADHKRHSAYYDAVATAHAFVHMINEKLSGQCTFENLLDLCAIETQGLEQILPPHAGQGSLFN